MSDPIEPGYTTTEFWLTLAAAIVGLLQAFGIVRIAPAQMQAIAGVITIVVPVAVYALSRAWRKQTAKTVADSTLPTQDKMP